MSNGDGWYYVKNGETVGPVSRELLDSELAGTGGACNSSSAAMPCRISSRSPKLLKNKAFKPIAQKAKY